MSEPVSIQRPLPPCVAVLGEHGTMALYHEGEHNRCPSCGATQWHVGRIVATCARCDAPIPIVTVHDDVPGQIFQSPTPEEKEAA